MNTEREFVCREHHRCWERSHSLTLRITHVQIHGLVYKYKMRCTRETRGTPELVLLSISGLGIRGAPSSSQQDHLAGVNPISYALNRHLTFCGN